MGRLIPLAVLVWLALPAAAMGQPPGPPPGGAGGRFGDRQLPPRDPRQVEAARGTAVVRGTIVAADTGSPIRRAQVRLSGQGVPGRVATTDERGRFEIKELPAGRYSVTASKGGFVSLQYGQRRPSESGTPLDLGDGQILDKVVIGLPRGSVITGRITDEYGGTPNRAAALGENVILLVNLVWSAWLLLNFIRRRTPFAALERWQTGYLEVYAGWAWIVVLVFPPLFNYV